MGLVLAHQRLLAWLRQVRPLRAGRILRESTIVLIARGLLWLEIGIVVYLATYLASALAPSVVGDPFGFATGVLPDALILGAIVLLTALGMDIGTGTAIYLAGEGPTKPSRPLPRHVASVVGASLRSMVLVLGGATTLLAAASLMGGASSVEAAISTWAQTHTGAIALIFILGLVGWFGGRLIRVIAAEVAASGAKLGAEATNILGGTLRWGFYAVLAIVAIFTALSAFGLGSVGGTVVVILSSIIGLVVAMAATGSIGNGLSGAVILAFRPLRVGDRITVETVPGDSLTGDVEEVSLMFTHVRALSGERVSLPNNLVLAKRIRNLSLSPSHAIVVRLGIAYNVSHALVRSLALQASQATAGILADPAPHVWAVEAATFSMQYDLYAYTAEPRDQAIRSELLGRLQDTFYGAGVEILTPDVRITRMQNDPREYVRVQVMPPQHAASDFAASKASGHAMPAAKRTRIEGAD
ncbi:MAG: mechanosensitive ion channel family protein [Thermoplasmatota archaeon]